MPNNILNSALLPLPDGTMLMNGKYRLEHHLNSGGFGNTYRASQIGVSGRVFRTVAIKEFFMKSTSWRNDDSRSISVDPNQTETFRTFYDKFVEEAEKLLNINNEHIVKVYDLFEENGTAYYVMDFIEGVSLSQRLKKQGCVSEATAWEWCDQLLDALATVHHHNPPIYHLDLKPANVMIDKGGKLTLIDFGSSKLASGHGGVDTSTLLTYTKEFAPKELLLGERNEIGPWTDLYSLGATLCALQCPQGIPDKSAVSRHRELAFTFPPEMSLKMRELIVKLMAFNPDDRLQSVEQVRAYIANPEPDVRVVTAPNESTNSTESTKPKQQPPKKVEPVRATPKSKPKSGNSKLIGILAAVALVIMVALTFVLMKDGSCKTKDKTPKSEKSETVSNDTTKTEADEIEAYEMFEAAGTHEEMSMQVTNKKITIPAGTCVYTGEVDEKGMPNGKGKAVFNDGGTTSTYTGPFVHGKLEGDNAVYDTQGGARFEGTFKNDCQDHGRLYYKDGTYFEGTFKNDERYQGVIKDRNGFVIKRIG